MAIHQVERCSNTNDTVNGNTSSVASLLASPGGDGISLREAIEAADNTTSANGAIFIKFDIGSGGAQTISPTSPLPSMTSSDTFIEGWTQPNGGSSQPIRIDGTNAGSGASGLQVTGASDAVQNLSITNFAQDGVVLGGTGNQLVSSYIGLAQDGVAAAGNGTDGVRVIGSGNAIGGAWSGGGNVISGNTQDGVYISGSGATGNTLYNNEIGTNAAGSAAIPNVYGVNIGNGATNNIVGGSAVGDRNVISGNSNNGILVQANNNTIEGNYIGTNAAGTTAIGNQGSQVSVNGVSGTIVGAPGAGNVISGGKVQGIKLTSATNTTIQGNYIGTDETGDDALGNGSSGIYLWSSSNNSIGGTPSGAGNIISANSGQGVQVDSGSSSNTVQGNTIGLSAAGQTLGNTQDGIVIAGGGNTIGGTASGAGNTISGNAVDGISLSGSGATANLIQGNRIGTNGSGAALGNGGNGITVANGSTDNTIGGGASNTIVDNGGNGVEFVDAASSGNAVENNYIGVMSNGSTPMGNDGDGILDQGADNQIGGDSYPGGDYIAANKGYGVDIVGSISGTQVLGSYIGTGSVNTVGIGNLLGGVRVDGSIDTVIGQANGNPVGGGNLISGNGGYGLSLVNGASGTQVLCDWIGTDNTGKNAIANSVGGVLISDVTSTTIGGSTSGDGNVISGNGGAGVLIDNQSSAIAVEGNYIGTDYTGTRPLGNSGPGVFIEGDSNSIGGAGTGDSNVISGNQYGIEISSSLGGGNDNTIQQNDIGTNAAGTAAIGNQYDGVYLAGGDSNLIGGGQAGEGNIISGNGDIGVRIDGATNTTVQGNLIGTNAAGTAALPNAAGGVRADFGATGTIIGGSTVAARNVISGNGAFGVQITGAATTDTTVSGNYIGVDVSGSNALANTVGIDIANSAGNQIGGTSAGQGNVISGNTDQGILVEDSGSTGDLIEGNYIGTDYTGAHAVANGTSGVDIEAGSNDIIGGLMAGAGNLIAGNLGDGILLAAAATSVVVEANEIGVAEAGDEPLANGEQGVEVRGSGNIIGGSVAGAGNVISGNTGDGILLTGSNATFNDIAGNTIGLARGGGIALANGQAGVAVAAGASDNVMGQGSAAVNLSGSFNQAGIENDGASFGSGLDGAGYALSANLLGTNIAWNNAQYQIGAGGTSDLVSSAGQTLALPEGNDNTLTFLATAVDVPTSGATNQSFVVNYTDGSAQTFSQSISDWLFPRGFAGESVVASMAYRDVDSGGEEAVPTYVYGYEFSLNPARTVQSITLPNDAGVKILAIDLGAGEGGGNTIADNSGAGVALTAGASNTISGNSISGNHGLGIDLGGSGSPLANTGIESGSVPNDGMNTPVITSSSYDGSTLTVAGYVGSASGQSVFADSRVEFFQTDGTSSGYGEGQTYLGSLAADAKGNFSGTLSVAGVSTGGYITATATDANGNTSEFGPNTNGYNVPTVATPAAASVNPVAETTVNLSVLGSDEGGESNLTYTWATTGAPPAPVSFSANGTNAAKQTTATFTAAGNYSFQVTITNTGGFSTTSDVNVTVNQTLTSISLSPSSTVVVENGNRQFFATGYDQFGNALSTQPPFNWTVHSGGGSINSSGLYTSPSSTGNATVEVTSGSESASASLTIASGLETITQDGGSSDSTASGNTLSWSHTVPSGSNRLLIVEVSLVHPGGGTSISSVTYGGVALSHLASAATAMVDTEIWYLVAPTVGTATVVVTASGGAPSITAGADNFVGVNQTNPLGAAVTATGTDNPSTPNITVNSSSSDLVIASAAVHDGTTSTPASGEAQLWNLKNGTSGGTNVWGAAGTEPGAASVNLGWSVNLGSGLGEYGIVGVAIQSAPAVPPTVATAASASLGTVTGKTTDLSVLGADDGGESNLTYTWAPTGIPPAAVTFSDNGDNSAKDTTATFTAAGVYDFQVTITNPQGLTTTSSVSVVVDQTLTNISIPNPPSAIADNESYPFTAIALDQFGDPMSSQPSIAWSVQSGGVGGSISNSGFYSTPASGSGTETIVASSNGVSGSAAVNVTGDGIFTGGTDIGGPALPGEFSYTSGTYTVTGGDGTNSSTNDVLQFANTSVTGDVSLVAQVSSINASSDALAGLTLRDGTSGDAICAAVYATASDGVVFWYRTATGAAGTVVQEAGDAQPEWLRLIRTGDTFSAFMSSDGSTWTQIGSDETFSAPATMLGGLGVTSNDPSSLATATFNAVSISQPTIASPASAGTGPVTGTTVALSVLGADPLGESSLTYDWNAVGTPPAGVSFSDNGDNSAQNTIATFSAAGTYSLQSTITDPLGLSVTSDVTVVVDQTLTTISVSPATSTLNENQTTQLSAAGYDQFNNALTAPPTFNWAVSTGIGSVNSSGVYTSPGAAGSAAVTATAAGVTGSADVTVQNAAPTVATPAAAAPATVTGTTTALSVLGADDGGEPNLTYTWTAASEPSGAAPLFSANGSNAAQNSIVTFNEAGNYTFTCTIDDGQGGTVTSSVNVTVDQTMTTIAVAPASAATDLNRTAQFAATADDQFGQAMATQPTFAWRVASGGGSINASGVYTAPATPGNATISATSGSVSGSASVNYTNAGPSVVNAAAASASPVTGTTTDLSVLGADDLGEADLTYNWAITSQPAGSNPQFSANNSNGSKDSTVTFDEAGEYVFTCTITDSLGASVTSSVDVTVNQTLTSILVTPGNTVLNENQTQPLNAVARDQFGDPLSTQPTINWSLAGGIGDIDSTGVYTSNGAAGSAVISATAAGITGHGWVTVRNAAPTVVTAAAAAPATVTGTTTALSILGADDGGEANLIYTWSATTEPSGATPLFSANGTNAAQNATVTFNQAGDYTFTCTISDGQGGAVTSSVNVTVDQTLTSLAVSPGTAAINLNGTQALTAIGYDQFNNQMATQPAFTWAIQSGAGSVDGAGNFTAPAADGSTTVSASVGALVSDATISYTNAGPQLTSAAAASQSTVTGTTVDLSVLASDDLGSSNLTYTWAASTKPEETNPHFSVNSSNSSNDTTVTFEKAGDYVFTCTITDSRGASITSSVTVTAAQTFTRIRLTPGTAHINENQTQQFSASALDQFGDTLRNRPTFIWSQAAVGGSIDSSGDYTAPGVPSTDTVTATASGISAMVTVDVTDSAPTIAVQPAASSSIVAGTTVDLSVLGASDGGESNLTYMWQATSQPVGSNPQFSANGSNAAKNTTVTFDSAGDYTFTVTITDAQGLSTSAAVSVAVDQTATSIVVTPISATIAEQGTESLTASELDQFGAAMASQPAFAWSVQGVGSVDSQGTYNAPAAAGSATVTAGDGSLAGAATISIINTPPTVATAAAASASTVTGTTVGLSVLGADDGGQSNLTYTWTAIGASPTCGTFTDNGDNSAQNTIVTFTQPGTYDLQATITDSGGLSVTSDITVNVVSTLTTISVTPASAVLDENASQQFVALALDQFGNALATQPTFTWAVTNGPGSIDEAGLYSANTTTGSATVTASSGGVVGTSQLNVRNAPPTVAIAASATASAIISRSTHLSVLGADDGGEENLTYTWAAIGKSPASVSFEINGTNAAKDTVATFSASGDYELRVTITDADGLTATSKVDVHVDQTLTSIAVNPGDVSVDPNTTIQLKAVGYDQFGAVMVSQPLVKWSVDGVGAIDQSGAYESGSADGTAVITANADGLHGEAFLLVGSNSVSPVTPPTPPLVPQPSPDVPIVVVPEPSPSPSNATPAPSPEPDPTPLPIINPGGNNSPTPTPLPAPKANGTPGNNGQTQQTKNGSQGNNNPAAGPVATPGSQVHSQFTPSEVAAHLAMKVHEQDMHLLQQEFTTIGEKLAPPSHMNRTVRAVIGSASAMAGTAVVGYVLWILRSSSLLAGALAGLPMWRFLDPLPVLDQWKSKKSDDDQDDSDKDQSTRKLEEMFK